MIRRSPTLVLVGALAGCAPLPAARPRAGGPAYRGLPQEATRSTSSKVLPLPASPIGLGRWVAVAVDGRLVFDAPLLDVDAEPRTWVGATALALADLGCISTEEEKTLRADLGTCGGAVSGDLIVRFDAVAADPAVERPRSLHVAVSVDHLVVDGHPLGRLSGALSSNDGSTFVSTRRFVTDASPFVPLRPPAPPPIAEVCGAKPRSDLVVAYDALFWLVHAIDRLARPR